MSNVSITLYNNDESRGLIAAILKDNPASTTMRSGLARPGRRSA